MGLTAPPRMVLKFSDGTWHDIIFRGNNAAMVEQTFTIAALTKDEVG